MGFELFIAMRHLMSRERRRLVSIITIISILGVIIGVAALIAVISVMDGAQEDYFKKLIDQYAHLETWQREPWGGVTGLENYQEVTEIVEADSDVIAASPVIQRFAMIKSHAGFDNERDFRPARIFGIDPEKEDKVSKLLPMEQKEDKQFIDMEDQGGPQLIGKRVPGEREIVLGNLLARQMRLTVGNEVYALTGKVAHTANGMVPKQSRLKVVGVFRSGLFEADQNVAYVSLKTAQDIYMMDDTVDMIHARVENPYQADAVRQRISAALESALPASFITRTWGELNPGFFKALFLEKLAMFIILLLIVIVAALNIISTLILVTMEKTRQIGILRAMGCSRQSISRIFMIQGALIGVVGTGLGVLLGLLVCWVLENFLPKDILPPEVYGLDGLPVLIKPVTVALIMGCSVGICLLASILPAFNAARLDIVEALRHE